MRERKLSVSFELDYSFEFVSSLSRLVVRFGSEGKVDLQSVERNGDLVASVR